MRGPLGDNISDITFDLAGGLFGVIGDGGLATNTLGAIDPLNGAFTAVAVLNTLHGDGEAICRRDALLYRMSGYSAFYEGTVDQVTGIEVSIATTQPLSRSEATSCVFDELNGEILFVDLDDNLQAIDSGNVITTVGVVGSGSYLKGLAIVP